MIEVSFWVLLAVFVGALIDHSKQHREHMRLHEQHLDWLRLQIAKQERRAEREATHHDH